MKNKIDQLNEMFLEIDNDSNCRNNIKRLLRKMIKDAFVEGATFGRANPAGLDYACDIKQIQAKKYAKEEIK